jgi:hypothetical protein
MDDRLGWMQTTQVMHDDHHFPYINAFDGTITTNELLELICQKESNPLRGDDVSKAVEEHCCLS